MQLFQNFNTYPGYRSRLTELTAGSKTFDSMISILVADRYCASHMLKPTHERQSEAFLTAGDNATLQRAWAAAHGMRKTASLEEILLAQIEHHRADVFYNNDAARFDGRFAHRLPSHVKRKIAWRAAPGRFDLTGYDLVVNNFPRIRKAYELTGVRTAEFFPSHDPELDAYVNESPRTVDVIFIGTYSRHHKRRREMLETLVKLGERHDVAAYLELSRYARLAELTPAGLLPPLSDVRRPRELRRISQPSIFGREMYAALASAKIVLNISIDMAAEERGNMRCFEAMGAGASMLTDAGSYPAGMVNRKTMRTYTNIHEIPTLVDELLSDGAWQAMGIAAHNEIKARYSKERLFEKFLSFL